MVKLLPVCMNSASSSQSQPKKSQATSCAECRRLKLKCDRVWPCAQCLRRGCGNLCPEGTLQKGKRGFLKRLEQALPQNGVENGDSSSQGPTGLAMFRSRDAAMAKRIQELEAALISAGVEVPGLSRTQRSKSKSNNKKRARTRSESPHDDEANAYESSATGCSDTNDVAVGFGTLTIDPKNRTRYVGLSSGSAYLDSHLWGSRDKEGIFVNTDAEYLEKDIEAQIAATLHEFPLHDEAVRLANLYYQHLSFMYEIVPKAKFFSVHLPSIYNHSPAFGTPVLQHTVALVGIVLALGQYFDLDQPREIVRPRAVKLFRLAAFALNSHSIIDGGLKIHTIQGVQTLHLMALFNLSIQHQGGVDNAWQCLGLAARSMQAQGFHMDGSRWNLPDLEERRRVFWEVYVYDRLQSFTVGRPYALNDAHYDCKMPTIGDTPSPSDNDPSSEVYSYTTYHIYKFKWAILLGRIMDNVFCIKRPTYATIMEYDREINDFYHSVPKRMHFTYVTNPVDPLLWRKLFPEGTTYDPLKEGGFKGLGTPEKEQQDSQTSSFETLIFTATLHMHRGLFCRTLMMDPKGMLKSRSIDRVISSSQALVNLARGMFVLHPILASRVWYWVFHAFSAAVCQAVFVIVAPFHPLAPQAFRSLRDAVELFEQVDGPNAKTALARLSQLVEKADRSMSVFRNSLQEDNGNTRPTANADGISIEVDPAVRREGDSGIVSRYPESNVRNAADLLGASTKLVREEYQGTPQEIAPISEHPRQPSTAPLIRHMSYTQMIGQYDTPKSLDLNQNRQPMLEQQYISHDSSQSSTELLPKSRSWMAGPTAQLPRDNYSDTITDIPSESPNSTGGIFEKSGFVWNPLEYLSPSSDCAPAIALQHFHNDLGSGVGAFDADASPATGYMNLGPHFNDVDGFDLSSFIQNGAKAWAYEPLTASHY